MQIGPSGLHCFIVELCSNNSPAEYPLVHDFEAGLGRRCVSMVVVVVVVDAMRQGPVRRVVAAIGSVTQQAHPLHKRPKKALN